jgi:hypothetical protein
MYWSIYTKPCLGCHSKLSLVEYFGHLLRFSVEIGFFMSIDCAFSQLHGIEGKIVEFGICSNTPL